MLIKCTSQLQFSGIFYAVERATYSQMYSAVCICTWDITICCTPLPVRFSSVVPRTQNIRTVHDGTAGNLQLVFFARILAGRFRCFGRADHGHIAVQ